MKDMMIHLIKESEEWLVERILYYAKKYEYIKYTSALREKWLLSVRGISGLLIKVLKMNKNIPELKSEEDCIQNPCVGFGITEARQHCSRGVDLGVLLGLFKYYRQTYVDLIIENCDRLDNPDWACLFIERIFDQTEIAFCSQWNKEAKRMEEYTMMALYVTRLKNSGKQFHFSQVYLGHLIGDSIQELLSQPGKKNIIFKIQDMGGVLINGDIELLKVCVSNVFDNIIGLSDQIREVIIKIDQKGDDVICNIINGGKDYSKDGLGLSLLFAYEDQFTEKNRGVGFVLSKMIMEAHSGSIEVRNSKNEGMSVTLKFKAVKALVA